MKANDFVRVSGLKAFRSALSNPDFKPNMHLVVREHECEFVHDVKPEHGSFVFAYGDVKQMVESHELVGSLGGLELAKRNLVTTDRALGYTHVYLHSTKTYCFLDKSVDYIIPDKAIEIKLAIKAIADVESCQ